MNNLYVLGTIINIDFASNEVAQKEINLQNHENRNLAIWTSLNFLFLFILIVLLIKKLKWS